MVPNFVNFVTILNAYGSLSTIKEGNNVHQYSRNPSLGFATKVRACKGAGQKSSLGITLHALGSVGECERMNPHTPK